MFELVGNEQVITGENNPLCLTTHRVRFEGRNWGRQSVDEIFLEDISYQALRMSSRPILLVLAGLSAVFAAYRFAVASLGSDRAEAIIAFVAALLFAVAYAVTRRQVLVLASSGGRIELAATSMPRETLDWFLLKLAEAKDRRFQGLSKVDARAAA